MNLGPAHGLAQSLANLLLDPDWDVLVYEVLNRHQLVLVEVLGVQQLVNDALDLCPLFDEILLVFLGLLDVPDILCQLLNGAAQIIVVSDIHLMRLSQTLLLGLQALEVGLENVLLLGQVKHPHVEVLMNFVRVRDGLVN